MPTVLNRSAPRDPPFPSVLSPPEPTPAPVGSRERIRVHDQHYQITRQSHVLRGERPQSRRRRPHGMFESKSSIVALLMWLSSMWCPLFGAISSRAARQFVQRIIGSAHSAIDFWCRWVNGRSKILAEATTGTGFTTFGSMPPGPIIGAVRLVFRRPVGWNRSTSLPKLAWPRK